LGGLNVSQTLKIVFLFVFHIVVASVLFAVLALAAFLLWRFTEWLKQLGAPEQIWYTCEFLSDLIFYLDVLCFLVFSGVEVWRLVSRMYEQPMAVMPKYVRRHARTGKITEIVTDTGVDAVRTMKEEFCPTIVRYFAPICGMANEVRRTLSAPKKARQARR
jgi:hypothetical protein